MDKLDVVKKIQEIGVVAVVRGKTPEEAMMMSEACIKGGVTAIELAFTTPRAHEVIEALSKKYADNPDVLIGAGTVLDAITARIAILDGLSLEDAARRGAAIGAMAIQVAGDNEGLPTREQLAVFQQNA